MISVLLPTRGRPALAARFLDSLATCAHRPDDIEVVLFVNDDDVESQAIDHAKIAVRRITGPSSTMGRYNTACLEASRGAITILANDDIVVRTAGWDERIRQVDAEYPDGVYLAYPNDLFKGRKISTFPILSRAACDLLVEPYPLVYHGGLIDYHLFDIFKRLEVLGHDRIRYLSDVVFEHAHYRTGKAVFDATYQRRRRFGDDLTFIELAPYRQRSAERLAAAIARRPLPGLPPIPVDSPRPGTSLAGALWGYARAFLGDAHLPLRWRAFLFTWYCGRRLLGKSHAGPVVL